MTLASKRGLTYPLQVTPGGSLSTSTDYTLVREHILSVIDTRPFERIMRAEYGLPDQVFDIMLPEIINSRISKAILSNVREVQDLEIEGDFQTGGEDGVYFVTIKYSTNGVPQAPIGFALQR